MSDGNEKSKAKWWLIGGCGCLLLVAIIAALVVFLGGNFAMTVMNKWNSMRDETIAHVLGKEYTPPKKYFVMAFPIGKEGVNDYISMADTEAGRAIIGLSGTVTDSQSKALLSNDEAGTKEFVKEMINRLNATSNSQKMAISDIQLESISLAKLQNGKSLPVLNGRMTMTENGREHYLAATVMIVLEAGNNVVTLIEMAKDTVTPNADFSGDYQALQDDLYQIITDSELDDRAQSGQGSAGP